MIFWKLIDLYALNNLHKKRSKEYQYSFSTSNNLDYTNIESFYKVGSTDIYLDINYLKNTDYSYGKFQYPSPIQSGDLRNDSVVGEVFIHNKKNRPNVIFVHGWRMDSNERVKNIFHNKIMKENPNNLVIVEST
ncbi:hypothetical protein DJ93_5582 [Bacillus clarus]|uniref:Alpha/beta hydrolase family protein n=1 Tax=Bacillus clarus TaxID=2338372 RepID=A0A090YTW3_9BACI|nr:hypothetical protein DJ93_5582 [Bacillus clarus]